MAHARVHKFWWILWGVLTVAGGAYLALAMTRSSAATSPLLAPARAFLLPGETSHGHYQIQLACEACHSRPFAGPEALQEACVGCHGAQLEEADDKHPLTKFLDPRNAALLDRIDARQCISCHSEHRPEITLAMGVTVPADVCAHCHQDIAQDRPSHAGMAFGTCASAGCHNFHDNRALYEDFLLRHADQPALAAEPQLDTRDFVELAAMLPEYPSDRYPVEPLERAAADAPAGHAADKQLVEDWLASSHAAAGVNCSACHQSSSAEGATAAWNAKPGHEACQLCHQPEVDGFKRGRHGMRLAQGFAAMTPREARLPMREHPQADALDCATCHTVHSFDTVRAAVDACLGCHNDEHSLAYRESKHFALWQSEASGAAPGGSGVSCATCHMPRVEHRDPTFDIRRVLVQHNQNDTLRPNEKMLRPVCLECHGMQFSLNALADRDLIDRNFTGAPQVHVRSLEMAQERLRAYEAERQAAQATTD